MPLLVSMRTLSHVLQRYYEVTVPINVLLDDLYSEKYVWIACQPVLYRSLVGPNKGNQKNLNKAWIFLLDWTKKKCFQSKVVQIRVAGEMGDPGVIFQRGVTCPVQARVPGTYQHPLRFICPRQHVGSAEEARLALLTA